MISNLQYDPASHALTFQLGFDETIQGLETDLAFGFDLGRLAGLQTSSTITLTPRLTGDIKLGVLLEQPGADFQLTETTPLNQLNAGAGLIIEVPDLRVQLRDGSTFEVTFDGATDVGQVLQTLRQAAADVGLAEGWFDAQINAETKGIDLIQGGEVPDQGQEFVATAINGSVAGHALRIVGRDRDGEGRILGGPLHGQTYADLFFIQDASLTGELTLTASDVDATANLGFIGVSIQDGTASGTVSASLAFGDPAGRADDGRITLREGSQAVSEIALLLAAENAVEFGAGTGTLQIELGGWAGGSQGQVVSLTFDASDPNATLDDPVIDLNIRRFLDSGGFLDVFGGFYISDRLHPDGTGPDVPEIVVEGQLTAGGKVTLAVAEAGVRGGIFATVDFDLNDPNEDGRIRPNELAENFMLGPIFIFDVSGNIRAGLEAFVNVNLFLFKINKTFELASITLVDFEIPRPEDEVILATKQGGNLVLNMGDGRENFTLKQGSTANSVIVEGLGRSQEFQGISQITGYARGGNDTITISEGLAMPVFLDGGPGDDKLYAGGGAAVLYGGEGNDLLVGGAANDRLFGGAGDDTLKGGPGADTIYGDNGIDTIYGDDSSGTAGGGDADRIWSLGGDDFIDAGVGNDVVYSGEGRDFVIGGYGDDELYGGGGEDALFGGLVVLSPADFDPDSGTFVYPPGILDAPSSAFPSVPSPRILCAMHAACWTSTERSRSPALAVTPRTLPTPSTF